MKKLFLIILATVLCNAFAFAQDPAYPTAPAAPQNIVAAEYFIDIDPGFGNATSVAVTPAVTINSLAAVINVNGLSNGVHRLYLRTKSAEGNWSLVGIKDFLYDFDPAYPASPAAAQNIVAAEYFIDVDPGIGNATPISITPGIDLNAIPVTVATNSLTNGTHRVYIRTKNQEGKWSLTNLKEFIYNDDPAYPTSPVAAQNIVAAEYFVDTDPGIGNATSFSVTAATNTADASVNVNTTGLSNGIHRVYIRTKNQEGKWSLTNVKDFIVNDDPAYPTDRTAAQNIVAAEYFIDNDPGFGSATAITVAASTDINGLTVAANTPGLSNGVHRIYIRTKSQEGKWSLTNQADFLVNDDPSYPTDRAAAQTIIAAEYFIDNDPGFGSATSIAVAASTDINNLAVTINTNGLSNGQHTLYIRTKSQEGKWSITNNKTFFTDLIALSNDTLKFGNVPLSSTIIKNLTITNNSATSQTINTVTVSTPFSTNFSSAVTIPAGGNHTMQVSFTPSAALLYEQTMQLQTTSGNYNVVLNGTGISQLLSWAISPAGGYNYGNVTVGSTGNYTFSITNSGNVSVTLSNVTTTDAAFVPTFTAGTSIPAGGSINLPVAFSPSAVGPYNAQLKIESSTPGLNFVTTTLSGSGYNPGTPPVLQYISVTPFNGTTGVNPAAGQTGNYTYKILYKSSNNLAPQNGYPKIGIDINGDQDFVDINEGIFSMSKEGSSTDYVTGVVYSYSFTHTNYTNTAGYKFFAVDANGNTASMVNTNYISGPVVTDQQLDLRIFANNISFSKNNPLPGETFTVFAQVSNSTAVPATNVPVKFYRDTILIAEDILPAVNAFSNATISRTMSFAAEGFYPIKVWIDSSNTLGDLNPLNNYAIRPVIVGSPILPGGINVTTTASVQICPQLKVIISGHAQYFGTQNPTAVAGAEVTINTGTQLITTTTNSNGDYTYILTGVTCGNNFTYNVSVTDFTLTSSLITNSLPLPCPAPNTCASPAGMGGTSIASSGGACSYVTGSTGSVNVKVKYRERNISNMWSSFDMIWKDTVKVFVDGVLTETFYTSDIPLFGSAGTFPGDEKMYPVNITFSTPGAHVVTAVATYIYNEFLQIPTSIYAGQMIPMTATGSVNITVQPNLPDLTVQGFSQTGYTAFSFQDANSKCVTAGSHTVKVYDSIPGAGITLIKTSVISSLSGGAASTISHSDPTMSAGTHIIKVITDSEGTVNETDENNNVQLFTVVVPESELSVPSFKATPTAINTGGTTNFVAVIKNSGRTAGSFDVRFTVNGVQVGATKTVTSLGENASVTVTSDAYTVGYADNACGVVAEVIADVSNTVTESNEMNNSKQFTFSPDLKPYQLSNETGSAANPAVVRVNTTNQFYPAIRNIGYRDVRNVTVRFTLNSNWFAADTISAIKAGEIFAAHASFTHMFTVPGIYEIKVIADTANTICEPDETNNEGSFFIRVVDSKADFEVLSQFISPSSLNPNLAQNITIVGTVRNTGGKVTPASVVRFLVDDIQLGTDVPINALQPGKDTTVAATATYSSIISGLKVMKLIADPATLVDEEREDNNLATRTIIVGDAPDMARSYAGAISFNPSGFKAGDSVNVSFIIKNNGTQDGTAWVRFYVKDTLYSTLQVDSTQFFLASGGTVTISRKMFFALNHGYVITEIDRCSPMEFDLLNNTDTLRFDNVAKMKKSLTINSNLDMKQGVPSELPGWIGGKIILGDYDLTVNGVVTNFDTSHFIITNGAGKLKFVNSNSQNTFPVGTGLYQSNFVKINNTGTQDNFSVRVVPYVLVNGTNGDTIRNENVNRTWFIEEQTTGGSNASVEAYWFAADELPAFNRSASKVSHYTTSWQLGDAGAAVADTLGRFSRVQNGYTSFSPFSITSGIVTALPLQFIEFTAKQSGKDVQLAWVTDNEENTSHFDVEYSDDGILFRKIAEVKSNNTPGKQVYRYTHIEPQAQVLYYRIRQVDKNGSYLYSTTVRVNRGKEAKLMLYPNPVTSEMQLSGLNMAEVKSIQLIGMNGKLVRELAVNYQFRYNVSSLQQGVYFIRVLMKNMTSQTISFIKQ